MLSLQLIFIIYLDFLFCSRRVRAEIRATFLFPVQIFFSPCRSLLFCGRKHGNRANPPFPGCGRNCATHLDSAPLHLGRGFRHIRIAPDGQGYASIPCPSDSILALLNCCTQKNRRPHSSSVCKNSDFQMRDQGFEPWTPWLRVRCSTNWANRAFSIFLTRSSQARVIIIQNNLKCKP